MSLIEALAKHVGSRRYARDLLERPVTTRPWWPRSTMGAAEAEEQRRSFAYGNASLSNSLVTHAMVHEAADRLNLEERK